MQFAETAFGGDKSVYEESFPGKLKQARENLGLTQKEVARQTNINSSTLANYELGRTQPNLETLGLLADFYGVSVDWLLGTARNKP